MSFPWTLQRPQPLTPMQELLERLGKGVPPELAARAAGFDWEKIKDDPEVIKAEAAGEIHLFEQARDSGVSGTIRAAMRRETNTWTPRAEAVLGISLEDYLKD